MLMLMLKLSCFLLPLLNFTNAREPYVIGGLASNPGDSPYVVHLNFQSSGSFFCGGVIIAEQWVVSAAHCRQPASAFKVTVGDYDRSSVDGREQQRDVSDVIVHPFYTVITHDYDVMLIKLKEPLSFNEYIQAAPLVASGGSLDEDDQCTVCGWGNRMIAGEASYPSRLRCVNLPLISSSRCDSLYSGQISEAMFCLGVSEGGRDACDGDSGSAVMCKGELHGVVAWGYGCANPNFPGVYTKLALMRPWMNSIMQV